MSSYRPIHITHKQSEFGYNKTIKTALFLMLNNKHTFDLIYVVLFYCNCCCLSVALF